MGRYAQRRRAGGGPPGGASLITITSAELAAADTLIIAFSAEITAGDFSHTDFTSHPNFFTGIGIVQDGPTTLEVEFNGDVDGDFEVEYSGTVPGVATPQTVPIT